MALRLYGDGNIENVTSINTAVSSTELGYLDGVSSDLQQQIDSVGVWQSWTPSATNITVGNGTLAGSYVEIGQTVVCRFNFLLGTTSAVSGSPNVTPPIPFSGEMQGMTWIGSINDNGTSTFPLYVIVQGSGFGLYALAANSTYLYYAALASTVPMTWANLDWMRFVAVYRKA